MIEDVKSKEVRDAILVKTLLDGHFRNENNISTLTPKGFVGANIVAARMGLQVLTRPILENDIQEIIKFLNDAENALDLLEDKEQ